MHIDILPKLWLLFCYHHLKIQKMNHFWNFNDYDNLINDPTFLIYSLSSIRWYKSFLHFRTFKIEFYEILTTLHYVVVQIIHICTSKMTHSSLLTYIFFCIKIANFWYVTSIISNLILAWPQSHGRPIQGKKEKNCCLF